MDLNAIVANLEHAAQRARIQWRPHVEGEPAPEVWARLASAQEIPPGALSFGRKVTAAGWYVLPTYARGFVEEVVKCAGGIAIPSTSEGGEEMACPTCGNPGAASPKTGQIRSHAARGNDGAALQRWLAVDTVALRMARRTPDPVTDYAVAVWTNGRFDFGCRLRPVSRMLNSGQLLSWMTTGEIREKG